VRKLARDGTVTTLLTITPDTEIRLEE